MNGWLCLNKPAGMSSNFAMQKVRRILREKTGYIGTLDPFATGVLPIAVGEARKFIRFIEDGEKKYSFAIKFGVTTDTLDRDGTIIESDGAIPDADDLLQTIESMHGKISQIPPKFSAIKVQGKKAYQLARRGKEVKLTARNVVIHRMNLLDYDAENGVARVTVLCSKGTYVRSLVRDIAANLETIAFVEQLRRLQSGFFRENMCVHLDELSEASELIAVDAPLNFEDHFLPPDQIDRLQNGLSIDTEANDEKYVKIMGDEKKFFGVGYMEQNKIYPIKMMAR